MSANLPALSTVASSPGSIAISGNYAGVVAISGNYAGVVESVLDAAHAFRRPRLI